MTLFCCFLDFLRGSRIFYKFLCRFLEFLESTKLFCTVVFGLFSKFLFIQFINIIVSLKLQPTPNHFFSIQFQGNRLWTTPTTQPITCLCLISLKHLSLHLIAVGLKGGSLHLYHGRQPIDYVTVPDTACAITFGQLGQEDHVLIVITVAGTLNYKILKRTADFSVSSARDASPLQMNKPLPLPKRSKWFLEQSMRERENPIEMHRNFQQDLVRLRLIAASALAQNLADQTGVGNEGAMVKVAAQVIGLGPRFTVTLTIENMHSEVGLLDLFVVFQADVNLYKMSYYYVKVIKCV